ncbi:MAG: FtsQ-type POTRA domain-containing protein [Desulfobacterales bacterium]|nr:FtsQ-type POTRA domain-containing protein [Desulfobacterales bacterium]
MAGKPSRKNYYKNSALKESSLRKRRWIQIIKTVGFLSALTVMSLGFVLCHDFLTQYDYFNAQDLVVTGGNRLTADDIIRQANIQRGINILSLNLTKTRKRLLAHPWIEEADISRKLPNEIHIHIREQQAMAVIDLGRKFIINAGGGIFKEWGPTDPENLPVITGLQFSDINASGTHRTPTFEAVMTVLTLGREGNSVLPNKFIQTIRVDREIGLTLLAFGENKQIKLGYDDYPGKYENLKNILIHLRARSAIPDFMTIDLNDLNRVVVHPVKTPPTGLDQKEV